MTLQIREWRGAGARAWRVLALACGLFVAVSASDDGAYAQLFSQFSIPTPGSSPQSITLGPDGALWFTEFLGNKIASITTAGVVTEYPIPTAGSHPQGIVAGPDGALWFTESAGNQIGR